MYHQWFFVRYRSLQISLYSTSCSARDQKVDFFFFETESSRGFKNMKNAVVRGTYDRGKDFPL